MAIFGKNGLWAAGITLVSMWALYGKKNSGFKNQAEIDAFKATRKSGGRGAQKTAYEERKGMAGKYPYKTEEAYPKYVR